MSIKSNIKAIQKTFGKGVKIVAVTKNRPPDQILEVIEAGIIDIGESRLQEAKEKLSGLPDTVTKHFVGRLQTNKVREVIRLFDVIQSVDSLKLAQKISQECGKLGKTIPILIQVNTSNELQKGGVSVGELDKLIKEVSKLPNVRIEGLMTIAVRSDDERIVRDCFKKLLKKFEKNRKNSQFPILNSQFKWLSMGMSEDYKIAIEEGSNMVRIGRGIFNGV
jgi:pyridoxal phosphate enzyme (YggS family)